MQIKMDNGKGKKLLLLFNWTNEESSLFSTWRFSFNVSVCVTITLEQFVRFQWILQKMFITFKGKFLIKFCARSGLRRSRSGRFFAFFQSTFRKFSLQIHQPRQLFLWSAFRASYSEEANQDSHGNRECETWMFHGAEFNSE